MWHQNPNDSTNGNNVRIHRKLAQMEYLLWGTGTPSLAASHDDLGVVRVLVNSWLSLSSALVEIFYPQKYTKE